MEQVTNIVIQRWGGRAVLLDQGLDRALVQVLVLVLGQVLAQAGEVGKSTMLKEPSR
ncbi:MAG: hypothetical protein K0M46_00105 [Thiobacillus sp.]|nr:hypothetical protein [Thiobacillus sp.]